MTIKTLRNPHDSQLKRSVDTLKFTNPESRLLQHLVINLTSPCCPVSEFLFEPRSNKENLIIAVQQVFDSYGRKLVQYLDDTYE